MEYNELELKEIYNNALSKKNTFKELRDIQKELELICPIIEFDSFVLQDIINTLFDFKKLNILDNVNKESIDLLRQIIYGNKQDTFDNDNNIYFNKYLRNLLLPFDKNKCDKDYNLKDFLSEFDIFINLIRDNCNIEDYQVLYQYNQDLYEIISRFYTIMQDLEETNMFLYGNLKDRMLLNGIVSHLATLLYLSLDQYDYQYDLLGDTFEEIRNVIIDFMMICDEIKIFQDVMPIDDKEILREYEYALSLLKNNYKEKNKRRKL